MSDHPAASDRGRTAFVIGILGWAIPTVLALPLAWGREVAGGEAALWAGIVGSALAVIGCAIAGFVTGVRVRPSGSARTTFGVGLAGVAASSIAILVLSVVIETYIRVLRVGLVGLLLLVPLAIAYTVGFGLGRVLGR